MKPYFPSLALIATLLAGQGHAQNAEDRFGVWRRSCGDGPCQIFLGLRKADTGEAMASVAVVHDKATARGSIFIELPNRVALPPGVSLKVGDVDKQIPYQFCHPDGCVAIATLPPEMETALGTAETADLSFVRYGSGSAELVPVPVTGFAEAYDSLK